LEGSFHGLFSQGYLPAMFQVLHSSAGAGKTHALVKHYLSHCLKGDDPTAYRQVLALTFTNKAAAEMKERVMQYLEALAKGRVNEGRFADVMEHLVRTSGSDQGTITRRADAVLSHMLHHWSDVAISTIDTFTRRVVQPFARDLQLDHELRMTTEQKHYLDRAVEELIGEAGQEPTLTGLLTEVCLQLLHEERPWDPEKPLRDLSQELTKESAIVPLQRLSALDVDGMLELARSLRGQERAFVASMVALGNKALKLIQDQGLSEKDFFQSGRGIIGYFRKLASTESVPPPPNSHAIKTIDEGKWAGGKADASAMAALDIIVPELEQIYWHVEDLRGTEIRAHIIRRAVSRELPTAFTLISLEDRLESIKREDGVAFFSDLTRKVAQVVKHEPVPFIHERMGERYRHYLIDEFQDTSLLQWNALLPLVDNALSAGGSALLVGDAKQAIYRWRNGEVRLFTNFPKLFGRDPDDEAEAEREKTLVRNYMEATPLANNHRSASTIIAFNNAIFESLGALLPEQLRTVYADHAQGIIKPEEGLVHLKRLEKDVKGDDLKEAYCAFTMLCIRQALEDGFSPGDIAVLVRGKSVGHVVAAHLVANDLAVVSPDGLQLSGDPLIESLIDLMRFIHTEDVTAAARATQYLAMLRSSIGKDGIDPYANNLALPDPVKMIRSWLAEHHYPRLRTTVADLVTELARALGYKPGSDVQLLTLLDEVHAWTTDNGQDIGGFIAHWERTGGQRSIAPPEHGQAVQVMTVHKAKGLQFPVVIVPQITMASRGNHGERHWIAPGDAVPELAVALIREGKELTEAELPELQEENELRLLDLLNLTYVAFTRPEQRLYGMLSESATDAVSKGLLAYMEEHGSEGVLEIGQRSAPWKTIEPRTTSVLNDVSSGNALGSVVLRFEAPMDWDPEDPDPKRAFGNAVHYILERVLVPEQLDAGIAEAIDTGMITAEAAALLAVDLKALLYSPNVRPWFDARSEVRNEATIITAEGKALRPDRVLFDDGLVRVLDIKTGKPDAAHHEQVRSYMAQLIQLGHPRVEGALLYVGQGLLENVTA
jgi:ATP-dependent exoDNAse (exonuclease V) beta subunit